MRKNDISLYANCGASQRMRSDVPKCERDLPAVQDRYEDRR